MVQNSIQEFLADYVAEKAKALEQARMAVRDAKLREATAKLEYDIAKNTAITFETANLVGISPDKLLKYMKERTNNAGD